MTALVIAMGGAIAWFVFVAGVPLGLALVAVGGLVVALFAFCALMDAL